MGEEQRARTVQGVVEETLPKSLFRIRLDDGRSVRATLSTQAKRVTVKVLPGDRVELTLSPYDPTRGRITARI
jgi:translation initiation factor IF-1